MGASKRPGDSSGSFIDSSVTQSAKTGWHIGTTIASWIFKNRYLNDGHDSMTADSAAEAIKSGRDPTPILEAGRQAEENRRTKEALRHNPPPLHGSAQWAQNSELHPLKGNPRERSILLGSSGSDELVWNGQSHLLTVAPTRTGKATMQIIPNLLSYKGSCVVLDPKGELYEASGEWRKQNVGPVYCINPFGVGDAPSHGFNPIDSVDDEHEATKLAEMIYPRTMDDRQRFFDNEAIGLLAPIVYFIAKFARKEDRTIATIRDTVSSLSNDFYGLIKAMSDPSMPPFIQNAANTVKTKTKDVAQPRLIDSLSQHLRLWDTPGLREATSRSDIDFKTLKDTPATVYLILPFDEIGPFSTFVQMVFAAALDAMLENKSQPDIPVLFIFDEFLSLEADERFVSALRTHASVGARLWFFLQDLPTLEQKYPTNWKSFLQAEVKTFFGTDDHYTAEMISTWIGDTTVSFTDPGGNVSVGKDGAHYSISDDIKLSGRRLILPNELLRFFASHDATQPRNAIHFVRGIPPIRASLQPYFATHATVSVQTSQSRHYTL